MSTAILGPNNNPSYIVPQELLNYKQDSTRYFESVI